MRSLTIADFCALASIGAAAVFIALVSVFTWIQAPIRHQAERFRIKRGDLSGSENHSLYRQPREFIRFHDQRCAISVFRQAKHVAEHFVD
jgi:hypothetical protein